MGSSPYECQPPTMAWSMSCIPLSGCAVMRSAPRLRKVTNLKFSERSPTKTASLFVHPKPTTLRNSELNLDGRALTQRRKGAKRCRVSSVAAAPKRTYRPSFFLRVERRAVLEIGVVNLRQTLAVGRE